MYGNGDHGEMVIIVKTHIQTMFIVYFKHLLNFVNINFIKTVWSQDLGRKSIAVRLSQGWGSICETETSRGKGIPRWGLAKDWRNLLWGMALVKSARSEWHYCFGEN